MTESTLVLRNHISHHSLNKTGQGVIAFAVQCLSPDLTTRTDSLVCHQAYFLAVNTLRRSAIFRMTSPSGKGTFRNDCPVALSRVTNVANPAPCSS